MNFKEMKMGELVTTFNEMVLTATDLGLPGFKVVKSFHDAGAGVKRCTALHEAIQKAKGSKIAPVRKADKAPRGRKTTIPDNGKISVLVDENPKRGKAKDRFAMYREGMLVSTYKEKVGDTSLALATLRWDVKQKFIKITS